MGDGVRVQKVLADAGVASRRGAEALIAAGRVAADGVPVQLGQRVDPTTVRLTVDGRPIGGPSEHVHLLLAKPAGVTSTVRDRHAARAVIELVPADVRRRGARLYPVGRLDRESEGLILLTNDGAWADRVLHPRHGVEREYAVALRTRLTPDQRRQLEQGIPMEEGLATVAGLHPMRGEEVSRLSRSVGPATRNAAWYRVVLRQGWKRQVRRMFNAVGAPVDRLIRVRIGQLSIDGMRLGESRQLSADEVAALAGAASALPGDNERRLAVAVDGPGGSGKSTVGAMAATRLGYRFCDTGVLYRGLTWLAITARADLEDPAALLALVPRMELAPDEHQRYVRLLVDGRDVTDELHTAEVDAEVSRVSRHPEVRAALLPIQRSLAAAGGMIMAGRDIGTVVLPDADVKIYLDVSIEERTRRRAIDRGVTGDRAAEEEIARELRRRDGIDSSRLTAPLRIPEGAIVIKTDMNTLEQTVDEVVALVERQARGG